MTDPSGVGMFEGIFSAKLYVDSRPRRLERDVMEPLPRPAAMAIDSRR